MERMAETKGERSTVSRSQELIGKEQEGKLQLEQGVTEKRRYHERKQAGRREDRFEGGKIRATVSLKCLCKKEKTPPHPL